MQFGSMLVYCTVYNMCVCGGAHINILSGGPQSSSYGPADRPPQVKGLVKSKAVAKGVQHTILNDRAFDRGWAVV